MSRFSSYNEELGVNAVEDTGIYATGENLKKYISTMEDGDLENFIIIKSKLLYIGTDEKETEIANRLGIGGGEATSDAGATVKEVQAIVDGVVEVSEKDKEKIPVSDTDKTNEEEHFDDSEGLIGTRLFDRSSLNLTNGNWNILIEYNNQNKETARYGSGYYWLKKGQKYTIKGDEIEFKNDYVINYQNEEFTVLSGRAVNWNVDATLGVPDEIVDGKHTLALNLDPMSLANGEWKDSKIRDNISKENFFDFIVKNTDGSEVNTGIQKTGDVEYDRGNKALKFNESADKNPNGEGGYIKLLKNGLDFKNGLTFEMYANLSRLAYNNRKGIDGGSASGLFCRMVSLDTVDFTSSMRFGANGDFTLCKFFSYSSWSGAGSNLSTEASGNIKAVNFGYGTGEDFYLTVVYVDFNKENLRNKNYDEFMQTNNVDKIIYYINGVEYRVYVLWI